MFPHRAPGTESLSKWVQTHPKQIEIMLESLKNLITPQMGFEGHPFSDVIVVRQQWNDKGFQALHKGKQRARTTESGVWKCSHNLFTGTVTAKICRDKEVGKVRRSFDVSFDNGEVAVLAIEMSKEEETWRRGTMGMTPHPTATNNIVDFMTLTKDFRGGAFFLACIGSLTFPKKLSGQISLYGIYLFHASCEAFELEKS